MRRAVGGFSLFTRFPFDAMAGVLERLFVPGLFAHFAARKKRIEDLACEAVRLGAKQVVAIGAGLDPLVSHLLDRFEDLKGFEVDHPATQQVKAVLLTESKLISPVLVPADLANGNLADALQRCTEFSAALPTLFIAEGLTMYLTESEVKALLSTGRALGLSSEGWIFTCMTHRRGSSFRFSSQTALADAWLHLKGEPFTWGIERQGIPLLLSSLGFSNAQIVDGGSAVARESAAQGEDIVYIPLPTTAREALTPDPPDPGVHTSAVDNERNGS